MKKVAWYIFIAWWFIPLRFVFTIPLYLLGYKWLWGKQSKAIKAYSKLELENRPKWYNLPGGEVVFLIKSRGVKKYRVKDFKQILKVLKPVLLRGDPNDDEWEEFLRVHYVEEGSSLQLRVPSDSEKETLKLLNKLQLYKKDPLNRPFDRCRRECYIWGYNRKYRNLSDW